jgi:hypothetical protein
VCSELVIIRGFFWVHILFLFGMYTVPDKELWTGRFNDTPVLQPVDNIMTRPLGYYPDH